MSKRITLGAIATVLAAAACWTLASTVQPEESVSGPIVLERSDSPRPAADVADPAGVALAESLATIDLGATVPEYRRDEFGDGWVDTDGNGCSTRNDVLARDLTEITWLDGKACTVATGTLADPYTGRSIEFQHDAVADPGNAGSSGVQIDHIISLSAAWQGGAWQWDREQRVAFANDFDLLAAVDGPANSGKGDRGPADWMPDNVDHWCDYASQYVGLATEYELAVSLADRQMLVDTLTACA